MSIYVDKVNGSISDAPWGATRATVTWLNPYLSYSPDGQVFPSDALKAMDRSSPVDVVIPLMIGDVDLTYITDFGFANCEALRTIGIPNSIITIGDMAFSNCFNLQAIIINKPEGSIAGSPWGAGSKVAITWIR